MIGREKDESIPEEKKARGGKKEGGPKKMGKISGRQFEGYSWDTENPSLRPNVFNRNLCVPGPICLTAMEGERGKRDV